MQQQPLPPASLEAFQQTLAAAIAGARSLDQIEAWLTSQPRVKSVETASYLLKSNPPQRVFIVELAATDGSTVRKVINVYDLGNERFQLHTLRDQ